MHDRLAQAFVVMVGAAAAWGCSSASDQAAAATGGGTGGAAARTIGTPIAAADISPAPPITAELTGTYHSTFALADALVQAINAGDVDTMLAHQLTESEFYWIVWPALPSNRPEVGMPWDYVWKDTSQKSANAARLTAARHRDAGLRLLRVEFDGETSSYGSFRVHRDARCVVELANGEVRRLDLFGSVIEMNGAFKAYSFVVD
jgi:hypothetical protein